MHLGRGESLKAFTRYGCPGEKITNTSRRRSIIASSTTVSMCQNGYGVRVVLRGDRRNAPIAATPPNLGRTMRSENEGMKSNARKDDYRRIRAHPWPILVQPNSPTQFISPHHPHRQGVGATGSASNRAKMIDDRPVARNWGMPINML